MYHIEENINTNKCTIFVFFVEKKIFEIPDDYVYDEKTYAIEAHNGKFPIKKSYTYIEPMRMPVPFYVQYLYIGGRKLYDPPVAGLIPLDCQYVYDSKKSEGNDSFEILPVFFKINFFLPNLTTFDSSLLKIKDVNTIYYNDILCEIHDVKQAIIPLMNKELYCFYKGKLSEYIPLRTFVNKQYSPINIFHFPGTASNFKEYWVELLEKKSTFNGVENLTIITFATNEDESPLISQLKRNGVKYINAVNTEKDWVNTQKIQYLLDALKQVNTDYVLILDGYDVVIQNLDGILEKFNRLKYRIIFNATHNNYPEMEIDKIPNRERMGEFCYLNAGACIGYKEDIKRFYEEVLEIQDKVENPNNSEQLLVRTVFAKYSDKEDNDFVFIDYSSLIFQVWNSGFTIGKLNDKYMLINIEQRLFNPQPLNP
jgi:hypothetical protein